MRLGNRIYLGVFIFLSFTISLVVFMYLAKVIGKAVSVLKHPAYQNRTLLLVQPLSLRSELVRTPTIAVDYVGAGEGDTVIVGAGPGVAQEVFGIENAPIRELIMGIVDHFDVEFLEETKWHE